MKENNYDIYRVLGNNVVVPDSVPNRRESKQKDIDRIKRNRKQRAINKEKLIRKGVLQIAFLVFVMGTVTIAGNSRLYSMQRSLSNLKSQVKEVESDNEALSLQLLKVSSIDNIQSYAVTTLGMVSPDKNSIAHENLSVNNFEDTKLSQQNNQSILSKIKDALF